MQLRNVSISSFRNIREADKKLRNLNALTGTNSSVKANFLDALTRSEQHIRHDQRRQFCNSRDLHPRQHPWLGFSHFKQRKTIR